MHYAQADPSRSNLPRDPVTGRVKGGPGRRKGQPNVVSRLAKDGINQVFEELGGVEGMVRWCRRSPKNLYAFYVHIWPRLLGAQAVDAAAERLAQRPVITRIENVIIDPKDDYRSTLIEDVPYTRSDADRTGTEGPGARADADASLSSGLYDDD
jgi:hypothetical protein